MINYEEALKIITDKISSTTKIKTIPLMDSVKHISAEDIYANHSLPSSNVSLKDGYALRDDGKHEVSTGELLEDDVIAVIPFEEEAPKQLEPFLNIKKAGEDIQKGELLLAKGEYINASNITPLTSQGIRKLKVFQRPKVSVLSIGDNLCPIQKKKAAHEIYNSNALTFAARILEIGANIHKVWLAKHNKKEIIECLKELSQKSDFIITTGAMSRNDIMQKLIYESSFEILFHKVQISPSSPSALSLYQNTPILSLPGLPLSSLLGFELLGIPTLKTIKNENLKSRNSFFVKNSKEFTCKESCTSAIPGFFDGITFVSAPALGAGMLNVLSKCNGYVLTHNKGTIQPEEKIEFFPF